jgi:hypothetical protein
MGQRFPSLTFRLIRNQALWVGQLHTGTDGTRYHVAIVCPPDYPRESPRVYPTSAADLDGELRLEHHLMSDGSLCLGYPRFDMATVTVADVAQGALLWLRGFESFIATGSWEPGIDSGVHPASGRDSAPSTVVNATGHVHISVGTDVDEVTRVVTQLQREVLALASERAVAPDLVDHVLELRELVAVEPTERRLGVIRSVLRGLEAAMALTADTATIWTSWGSVLRRMLGLP